MDSGRKYTNRRLTRRQRQQWKLPDGLGKSRVQVQSNKWHKPRYIGVELCLPCAAAWVSDGSGEWEVKLLPADVEPGECQCRWGECTYGWVRGKCGHAGDF